MLNIKDEIRTDSELDHLIKLLDDEDEGIYTNIRERFISHGDVSTDYLRNYTEDTNLLLRKRANEIISTINIEKLEKKFAILSSKKDILEEAVLLIAEFGYPGYDKQRYKDKLNRMADDIRSNLLEINSKISELSAVSIINAINAYLFDERKFAGNTDDYYNPDNSYINRVIDTGLGLPISLSVIYILLAKRLKLPVFGVNLPGHFIVKYVDKDEEYYIDPYNSGVIVSKDEAADFISNLGMTDQEFENLPYLSIAQDKDIVLRMLRNLSDTYKKNKERSKVEQIERLMMSLV